MDKEKFLSVRTAAKGWCTRAANALEAVIDAEEIVKIELENAISVLEK